MTGKQDYFLNDYPVIEDTERNGRWIEAEDHNDAYALKRVDNGRTRYYLKSGGLGGRIYDPNSMYGDGYAGKRKHGLNDHKWREVNKKAFNHYIEYLRTKNKAHYRNAEREAF